MSVKYINDYYDQIKDICKFTIDCKQGLYMSLLDCLGVNAFYCGAKWPWVFYYKPQFDIFDIKREKIIDLQNILTQDQLKNVYNIDLLYNYSDNPINLIRFMQDSIISNESVVILVDPYYIPYHHDYERKHGLHTTLIMGYDDTREEYYCFSVNPAYKGIIPYNDLRLAINNVSIFWCAVLRKSGNINPCISEESLFLDFQTSIHKAAIQYERSEPRQLELNMQLYTIDLLSVLTEQINLDDNKSYDNMKRMCEGRWGWETSANVNLMLKYLQTRFASCQYDNISSILDGIEKYRMLWDITFRKMYKSLRRKPNNMKKEIDNVLNNLTALADSERDIINILTK